MKKSQLKQLIREVVEEVMQSGRPVPTLNGKKVDVRTIRLGDVDHHDRPDYSDAFIEEASFVDGTPLSPEECEQLSQQEGELINTLANGG